MEKGQTGDTLRTHGPDAVGNDNAAVELGTQLLRDVFVDSEAALQQAEQLYAGTRSPAVRSLARQIIGIVLRDRGESAAALLALRSALRYAVRAADPARIGDVEATLGSTLVVMGRTRDGLRHLDGSVNAQSGPQQATVLVRRAWVYTSLGRHEDAIADICSAHAAFVESGDRVWEGRALNIRGHARASLGDLVGAAADFKGFGEIASALGHQADVPMSVHNRGFVAFLAGDLPGALALYSEAAEAFDANGELLADGVVDRCDALLAAGLGDEASGVVEEALGARSLLRRERALLTLALATAELARGDSARAAALADRARTMFLRQENRWLAARAELTSIVARCDAGTTPMLMRRAAALVEEMRDLRLAELPQALVAAGRLATESGSADGSAFLREAGAYRRAGTSLGRYQGWLATALLRHAQGDSAGVLRACGKGLEALEDHQATLGSAELRALASQHGEELAALATRTALARGRPRQLLSWLERSRATALATPPVAGGSDDALALDLAAVRALRRRIDQARRDGEPCEQAEREAVRLEQRIRQRRHEAIGSGSTRDRLDLDAVAAELERTESTLVELAEIDGRLYALVVRNRRVRRIDLGDFDAARRAVEFSHFALRQAGRRRPGQLAVAGERLEEALLGEVAGLLGDGSVVVSAGSRLQGVPWGLIPALVDRTVTTVPSALTWMRARSSTPPDGGRVLVVGPGLASGGGEVATIADADREAVVLAGTDATAERVLEALDGAQLAHIAAHGSFRDDSPMFSSLTMADGPLMVHDLERLVRAPYRVVLSACESGVMKPVGADEMLGLSAALLGMGTAGIVSTLAEVDDAATVEVMVAVHGALRTGVGLGEALLAARRAAAGDPVLAATAACFTAVGI